MVKKTVTTMYESEFKSEEGPTVSVVLSYQKDGREIRLSKIGYGTFLAMPLDQFQAISKFVEQVEYDGACGATE